MLGRVALRKSGQILEVANSPQEHADFFAATRLFPVANGGHIDDVGAVG